MLRSISILGTSLSTIAFSPSSQQGYPHNHQLDPNSKFDPECRWESGSDAYRPDTRLKRIDEAHRTTFSTLSAS